MVIANPIYDVIFKYLVEDKLSAMALISLVIDKNVVEIDFLPQENVVSGNKGFSVIRLDFIAILSDENGKREKILIEVQKSKKIEDIPRFRSYLASNYNKQNSKFGKSEILPITCIYFLGYATKVNNQVVVNRRNFVDAIDNKPVENTDRFMELLTHSTYLIYINNLKKGALDHALIQLLTLFDQNKIKSKEMKYLLESDAFEHTEDPRVKLVLNRLQQAALEEELLAKAQREYDLDATIEDAMNSLMGEIEEERRQKEEERRQKEDERSQKEEERSQKEEERRQKEEALKELAALKKLLNK